MDRGQLVEARTVYREGVVASEFAEVIGIKKALSWIKARQWEKTILESDCLVAINAIRSNLFMRSPFGLVVEECRHLLHSMSNVSFLFVYRSANKVTHNFARVSCSFPDRCFNMENVPIELLSTLLDDCSSY
ncbi:hypothetical protein C2S53_003775 [Perilla frutescens var. hirtella]|uniref:RNase H type-1 domain-containing protein n=1 Tax=Perilla frutescens var. hirtella TaxID=608512 RepID=A0AAD4NXF6_PERFH|nr:hypothetical protein C2S53_003775 [Perilla frutescens var. hirtella]